MDLNNYSIRKAVKEDCKDIQQLIQELADYEKMPEGPKIDSSVLENDGFGSRPFFEAYVAVAKESSKVVGYALYFYTYSTWEGKSVYLEDVYVQPDHRKNGIGLSFFKMLSQIAMQENCLRLNFSVLNWNKPSIDFYLSLGAVDKTAEEGWHSFRLNRKEIEQLASYAKEDRRRSDCLLLKD